MKRILLAVVYLSVLSSCSIANVANRGEYVDEKTVVIGTTTRQDLLTRFGAPADTTRDASGHVTKDLFRVPQGEPGGKKAAKGFGLFVADFFTLGLAEIVSTPVTGSKDYIMFEVKYDQYERVTDYKIIQSPPAQQPEQQPEQKSPF
jgi:hypothetical protein